MKNTKNSDDTRLTTVINILSIAFNRYKCKENSEFSNKELDLRENVSTNGLVSNHEENK